MTIYTRSPICQRITIIGQGIIDRCAGSNGPSTASPDGSRRVPFSSWTQRSLPDKTPTRWCVHLYMKHNKHRPIYNKSLNNLFICHFETSTLLGTDKSYLLLWNLATFYEQRFKSLIRTALIFTDQKPLNLLQSHSIKSSDLKLCHRPSSVMSRVNHWTRYYHSWVDVVLYEVGAETRYYYLFVLISWD